MKKLLLIVVLAFAVGISPVLISGQTLNIDYSTYLGGSGDDMTGYLAGGGLALGTDGTAYITGRTTSSNFPTVNPYQADYTGTANVFVTALSSSGSALIYSTYIGGSSTDNAEKIALGADKTAYLTGYTFSTDFPTVNACQATSAGSMDAFVTALGSAGSAIVYSTYLGGSNYEYGVGIALGSAGRAYVTGYTQSLNFPTENPYQPSFAGDYDAFVSGLSPSGSSLIYSTYLGGTGRDDAFGICVGTDGRTYVTGKTESTDFPTANPYQANLTGPYTFNDAFVTAFSSSGSALSYSTYLGSSGGDYGNGITLGSDGTASITGFSNQTNFPMVNPYQGVYGGGSYDAFITTLTTTGSTLTYSTYLGGNDEDRGQGIAIGTDGAISITGYTKSHNFPTANSYQAAYGGGNDDGFVTAFSSSGTTLSYSTYLGGTLKDNGKGISLGSDGAAYVSGYTESLNFPTHNAYQAGIGGGADAFMVKLILTAPPTPSVTPTSTPSPTPTPQPTMTTTPPPTMAPTASPTPTPRPTMTMTPPPTSTPTATPRATMTLTPPPTTTPTASPTPTPRATMTMTPPPTPARISWITDYNGDGTSDIAIFRESSGLWAIRGISRVYFGTTGDSPEPGDYDGDGTTDIAIYRSSSGLWALRGISRIYYGWADDPIPADYDGDGTTDPAIFRSSSGLWAARGISRAYFGGSSDDPIPGYYSGMGLATIAIYRPSSGLWAFREATRIYFGGATDDPIPGDYNGNGAWQPGIFRDSSGLWALVGVTRTYFGGGLDQPVPGIYSGDGTDDIGIYRSSSGLWAIQGVTRVYFGGASDIPVTR